jgi:TolB-like protein
VPYWLSLTSAKGGQPGQPVAADEVTSVAVLPFVNSDGNPEVQQFTDGLTEEVIHTLAEIDGLRVVSLAAAPQFKGQQVDLGPSVPRSTSERCWKARSTDPAIAYALRPGF